MPQCRRTLDGLSAQPGISLQDCGAFLTVVCVSGLEKWHWARGLEMPGQPTVSTPNISRSVLRPSGRRRVAIAVPATTS